MKLLTAALVLSDAGFGMPGTGPAAEGPPMPCPKCKKHIKRHSSHSARCPAHGWFAWTGCRPGCDKIAYRDTLPLWKCSGAHAPFKLPLCPQCWHWGKPKKPGEPAFQCGGRGRHTFYLYEPRKCGKCGRGNLVFSRHSQVAVCETCGAKVRRGGS
ncbi:hypothetical protein [Lentzea aerocolonigenes]|uniref:hypothetical protein n=1 Tax=Lentzea aerocolonigenes TaxID=68170 RepID=UPI0012E1188A|nr:hypothetical protein [Lentzea aerocolonigenes]